MTDLQLIDLKAKVEKAKTEEIELKSRKKYIMENLKEKENCNTIKEVDDLILKNKEKIEELDANIENIKKEIEEVYDF